ncbi:MAG: SpoIIIAH-like family protein [Clostridia bacterium]|nr:SpoIIIAH-like family protein [Clostridia bacterium]
MEKGMRRAALVAAVMVLLAADSLVTANLVLREDTRVQAAPASAEAMPPADALTRFRTEREQLRAKEEAELNDIIHDENTSEETRSQAQQRLLALLDAASKECILEGILQSRGFEDALISVNGGSVNAIVRRETLTQQESAVILELILRETGVTGGNVKIIPIK